MLRHLSPAPRAAAAILLSACSSLPPAGDSTAVERHYAPVFELEGRIAATDGEQAASGLLFWQHRPDSDTLTLSTPLGQIAARLVANAAGAELRTADGQQFTAASSAQLLPQLFGIEVPVQHLERWVQAAPGPSAQIREQDAIGRPTVVFDQGWRIDYPAYVDPAASALPRRVELARGATRIRLVIDSWMITP